MSSPHGFAPAAAFLLLIALAGYPQTALSEDSAQRDAWQGVVQTTLEYKASLERLLVFREQEVARIWALVERQREFLARGIIARRELDESIDRLERARGAAEETRQQIRTADAVLAEAAAREQVAAQPPDVHGAGPLVRFAGNGGWSLAEAPRIQTFFARRFGRPLPVSAWGQTLVHDRLGFDHRNALDIAVHPDSAEGRALLAFLKSSGLPFIAVRSTVPGTATGAHIHVGPESHRLPPN
jgi:hypothetical protein